MNANADLALVAKLIAGPTKSNLWGNFILKLNASQRNNFNRAMNKNAWMKRWLKEKHGLNNEEIQERIEAQGPKNTRNTFNRYLNSLKKFKNKNMVIVRHVKPKEPPEYVNLKLQTPKGTNKGYIQLEPVCEKNYNKGIYIHYGETYSKFRGQKVGERLRKAAVNAALNSKILLYQVSQNIEGLVNPGTLPISGKIMEKLGAHRISFPPPCRANNVRGPQNFAFVVGNKPLKRPISRGNSGVKRTLKKRRN